MEGNKEEAECLFVFCLYLNVAVEIDGKVLEQVIFIQATSQSRDSAAHVALIHVVGVDADYLVCLKNRNCSEMCALIFVIRFTQTVNIFDFGDPHDFLFFQKNTLIPLCWLIILAVP